MNESVGQQLRQAREARSLSLEQAAQATLLRLRYLRALEEDDIESLPSLVQARGFVRIYAGYLGLNVQACLAAMDGESLPVEAAPTVAGPPPPAREAVSSEQAETLFQEVGLKLRRQRELLGLTLDDVEGQTRLRVHYLRALEAGKLSELPSPVQGRGMLNNYAVFLGMNPEPLLLRFAEGLQAHLAARRAARPAPRPRVARRKKAGVSPLRRLLSGEVILLGGLVFALLIFVAWGAGRILAMRAGQTPSPTAPSIAEVLLAPASETLTPVLPTPTATQPSPAAVLPTLPSTADQTLETTLLAPISGAVQVYVTIRQRAWMRVLVDGEVQFEGRVIPGSAYQFAGEQQVEVLTGNGAALQVFYNQQDQGPMGDYGEVIDRIYTSAGIVAPTTTVTPTPTETERPSPTPRQSATLGSTPTPAP